MLLMELYQEGKKSTVTHNGDEYSVDELLKLADNKRVELFEVKDLKWILKDSKLSRSRIKAADNSIPIIVTRMPNGKYAVLDGAHRLQKSVEAKNKYIVVKELTATQIKRALIKDCDK